MKQLPLPYSLNKPPRAIRKARLDNIALVPASLLLQNQEKYQRIANNLPQGGVLICQTDKKHCLGVILTSAAAFFREHGHFVRTLPYSMLV